MYLDIHLHGAWRPCGEVALADPAHASRNGAVTLRYDTDYALEHLGARDHRALTVRAPVNLGRHELSRWPSFLVDLLPQGAGRKRLERVAGGALSEWRLLERSATNPVGNLRVRPTEAAGTDWNQVLDNLRTRFEENGGRPIDVAALARGMQKFAKDLR